MEAEINRRNTSKQFETNMHPHIFINTSLSEKTLIIKQSRQSVGHDQMSSTGLKQTNPFLSTWIFWTKLHKWRNSYRKEVATQRT